jgi:hypothetical protein
MCFRCTVHVDRSLLLLNRSVSRSLWTLADLGECVLGEKLQRPGPPRSARGSVAAGTFMLIGLFCSLIGLFLGRFRHLEEGLLLVFSCVVLHL